MRVREIIRLKPSGVLSLKEKATAGDLDAAKDFILYGIWKTKLEPIKASGRDKMAVLVAIADSLKVIWQPTT